MSENNGTAAVVTDDFATDTVAAPVETATTVKEKPVKAAAKPAKKAAAKPAGKAKPAAAPAKKAAAKPAAKTTTPKAEGTPGADKKKGLRGNQIKVLQCLFKAGKGLTRAEIATKTGIDVASLTGYIGPTDPDKRKYNDEKYFTTLVTYGYVKHEVSEDAGVLNVLTANGRKFVEKEAKAPKK